jgi:hypothetical protein
MLDERRGTRPWRERDDAMRDEMLDDLEMSADALLARAAQSDARDAQDIIARLPNPRLLEVVLSQAVLAVEPGRSRSAGIDALAELSRAAVELMGMRGDATHADDELPLLTGWELLTVGAADDLVGATTAVPARPWHLALIAFDDTLLLDGVERRVTAVSADMRFVTARLRIEHGHEEPVVLDACVTHRLDDLGARSSLAWGLWCALASAAEQR